MLNSLVQDLRIHPQFIIAGYIGKTATFGSITVTSTRDAGLFVAKHDPSGVPVRS